MPLKSSEKIAKHQRIYDRILGGIMEGKYAPGAQIPTEQELAAYFKASRPTVGRALQELEQKGLIYRKRGAGTFVRKPSQVRGQKLGILVPGVMIDSSELFGTMVSQMSREASERNYVLLLNDSPFGNEEAIVKQARRICQQLIDLRVSGVFFMPIEVSERNRDVNVEIAEAFEKAGIGVVLIDRDIYPGLERSKYDLVCVNNERASYRVTEHLLSLGCKNIHFIAGPVDSSAVLDRINGYCHALAKYEVPLDQSRIHRLSVHEENEMHPEKLEECLHNIMPSPEKPEAIICINDRTAAIVMRCLYNMGISIPDDVRLVGFDDLPFIAYLPVPLTTVRQPAESLAREAVRTLIDRLKHPEQPARDIILATDLIVRESCGANR